MTYNALRRGRASVANQVYLITMVAAGRCPLFLELAVGRLIVKQMRNRDTDGETRTLAYVVMPDHVHWLLKLTDQTTLSNVVKRFKGASAREINRRCAPVGTVWQPAFHDHAIRAEEALSDVALYVVMNPVRAGLVESIGDCALWDATWSMPIA